MEPPAEARIDEPRRVRAHADALVARVAARRVLARRDGMDGDEVVRVDGLRFRRAVVAGEAIALGVARSALPALGERDERVGALEARAVVEAERVPGGGPERARAQLGHHEAPLPRRRGEVARRTGLGGGAPVVALQAGGHPRELVAGGGLHGGHRAVARLAVGVGRRRRVTAVEAREVPRVREDEVRAGEAGRLRRPVHGRVEARVASLAGRRRVGGLARARRLDVVARLAARLRRDEAVLDALAAPRAGVALDAPDSPDAEVPRVAEAERDALVGVDGPRARLARGRRGWPPLRRGERGAERDGGGDREPAGHGALESQSAPSVRKAKRRRSFRVKRGVESSTRRERRALRSSRPERRSAAAARVPSFSGCSGSARLASVPRPSTVSQPCQPCRATSVSQPCRPCTPPCSVASAKSCVPATSPLAPAAPNGAYPPSSRSSAAPNAVGVYFCAPPATYQRHPPAAGVTSARSRTSRSGAVSKRLKRESALKLGCQCAASAESPSQRATAQRAPSRSAVSRA